MLEESRVPSWFVGCLVDARAGYDYRACVRTSYAGPGYHLGLHWRGYVDDDEHAAEEFATMQAFDDDRVISWMERHLGGFLAHVPKRRRSLFVEGFMRGLDASGSIIFG